MGFIKTTIYTLLITLGLATALVSARAAINPLLNFTGKVTEVDGSELADGNYDMSFRIFNSATGGAALWSEDLDSANMFSGVISAVSTSSDGVVYAYGGGANNSTLRVGQYLATASGTVGALIVDFDNGLETITVASSSPVWSVGTTIGNRPFVEGGVINVDIGTVADLNAVDFNQTLYLEVVFNGETMQPRKMYDAVPYAFNAAKLDGFGASDFANLSLDAIINGQWSFADALSVATSSTATALTVTQNGSGNVVDFKVGTTTAFAVLADGRVQIGDYFFPTTHGAAGYVLKTDASGNMYWGLDFIGGFGAGSAEGLWATNTAETLIHPIDTNLTIVIGNNATTTLNNQIFEVYGSSLFDTINISSQNELRFYDADSSNYMAWRATGTIVSDFVLTFPGDTGVFGQALVTDGDGNLRWGAPSSFAYATAGTAGQFAFYAEDGSQVSGTSSLFIAPNGNIGIGTTTPNAALSIGVTAMNQFLVGADGIITDGVWNGDVIDDNYLASSTYWNAAYQARIINTTAPITFSGNTIGLDGLYNIPLIASTTQWNNNYNLVNSKYANWDDVFASSSLFNWAYNTVNTNYAAWNAVAASSTFYNQAYNWGNHAEQNYFSTSSARILEVAYGGTGSSTLAVNGVLYGNGTNAVNTTGQGIFGMILMVDQNGIPVWAATTSLGIDFDAIGGIVPISQGGTGTTTLDNLITLGMHTTGNYISSTTGSNTITITGTPGEGWVPVFSVTDDSITASKLAVGSNGSAGYVLVSDGDGTFSWSPAGATSGSVKDGSAGQLAFFASDGIVATGTTNLFWDNNNFRLGIGTTTPGASLSVGTTINNQFLVNASGIITDGTWNGDAIDDEYIASSTYWNAAYFGRVISVTAPLTFSGNTIGLDGNYNIPLIASTTNWEGAYTIVNSKYANWDAVAASSSVYNWAYNTVYSNYSAWNAVSASSTFYNTNSNIVDSNFVNWNTAYTWGDHEGLYDAVGQATSTLNYHLEDYNHASYDAIVSSSSLYNWAYNMVNSNYADWNTSFGWGDHSLYSYFSTSTGGILEIANGGTGANSLNNLITLGTHTIGDYISSTTGSDTITITGTPGEGWVPVFSVTNDSITASKLAVGSNGPAGYVLTSDGDGTFSWTNTSGSGQVDTGFAGQLAFYASDGIAATGTTNLYWDNDNYRLGIGTTTPDAALSIGATVDNQFLVSASGVITDGTWNGDEIDDEYIASSTYWNAAYFSRIISATAPLSISGNTIGLDGLYNIPLIASTTQWNDNYNLVGSKYAEWDAAYASSTFFNTNSNIVSSNYLDWNAVVSSSSVYNWAYNTVNSNYLSWNAVVASSSWYNWAYNTVNNKYASWDAIVASSTFFNDNSNIVNSNYLNWNTAFGWGDHTDANYFSTSSARVLDVSHGGTGFSTIASGSIVYASSDNVLSGLPVGEEGEVLIVSGGNLAWASTSPAAAHNILSVAHGDAAATSTLVRGDLMVVNSDTKWSRLQLGPAGYILFSDGTDTRWATTTSITALGSIVQGSWMADTITIAYGGTGATTATGARENLDLQDIHEFGINSTGTAGWLWQSDGDGRGQWVATNTLGISAGTAQAYSKFIGTTTETTDGHFATGTLDGYAAGNAICEDEYPGSYFCRTYDILVTVEQDNISEWGTTNADAWIAQGPPGFTDNSNDCNGWNTNDIDYLGAFWVFNGDTGGYGKLVNCTQVKPLACCKWQ